jgi:hypothetical protein
MSDPTNSEPSTNEAQANKEAAAVEQANYEATAAAEQGDYESRPDLDETLRDGLDRATKYKVAAGGLTEGL